ncbi:MAG: LysR family transcriptional regulator [Pseudacidovorax sp.]|uniref:LysR substrate-binding domain-containing protein n=1 Tax=Pseudacidovorax sp. TaxID=1934311 RepID=UPI001B4DB75A|nr:LysR substrate-binding domain-containing protein [Pseudacidovorax sp.]MBP6897571.1 LysR family transcriptional regulator [Pseudacidovorax sp.]
MPRHLPSTRALLVFDAVARCHGVGKAAEELCLTHSAVSQQLRLLELQLGVRLVQRSARGTLLTEAGRRYHAQVAGDLLRLENHTLEAMAQRPDGERLLVGAVPMLAERWLLPRLPGFLAEQPACSVHLQVFPTQVYMDEPHFDVALQYDDASWPGAAVWPLRAERVVVVCAPRSRWRAAVAQGDFRDVPLLQLSSRLGAWQAWFAQAGIARPPANAMVGHRFDLFSMVLEAVRADLGIGLLPRYGVARELASAELCLAHPFEGDGPRGYSLFVAPHRAGDATVQAFGAWLDAQVAEESQGIPPPGGR